MPIVNDQRINFRPTPATDGDVVSLTVDLTGGPLGRVQVVVVNKNGKVIDGAGSHGFGQPLTTVQGGRARWSFKVVDDIDFVKWGIVAIRSGANLGNYTVVSRLTDATGRTLETGRFDASIPDGKPNDDIQFDATTITVVQAAAPVPTGATL